GDIQPLSSLSAPVLRVSYDGWTAVAVPTHMDRLPERGEFEPAGILGGALAVSELFQQAVSGGLGGYRPVGFSLWTPATSWEKAEPGPAVKFLPAEAWLVGLGHLGQAYLWTLGLLPYHRPDDVILFLQDTDELKKANLSTSILTV